MASIKDYILPNSPGIIDFPSELVESHLYRLALIVTRNILDTYVTMQHWFPHYDEETWIQLAFLRFFPQEWIKLALQAPNHYLDTVPALVEFYKLELKNESLQKIHTIVEFLCYEIIESSMIESQFIPISELNIRCLTRAIENDPVLKEIIRKHGIFIVDMRRINTIVLTPPEDFQDRVSVKALKLIILYLRLRVVEVFQDNPTQITTEWITSKFSKEF